MVMKFLGSPKLHNLRCSRKGLAAALVKVFGRRPSRTFPPAPRPASETLQGTKPREGARIGRCRALSYGDLAVAGLQLRSAARLAGRGVMALQRGWDAVFLISGPYVPEDRCGCSVVNAALKRAPPWPAEGRPDRRTAFRGGGCEIVIMRCRS